MTKITNFPYLMSFSKAFDEMVTTARNMTASTGREVCGVIGGRMGQIFECLFVENIAKDGIEFLMDPVGLSNALDSLDAKEYDLIALFHTHPGGPAEPSVIDIDKRSIEAPMIIISPTDIKAWRFKPDNSFDEVRLAIHDPGPKISAGPIKGLNTDGLRITLEVSGKVFEELPDVLTSFLRGRNGPNFEDQMQNIQRFLELARMGGHLREGDDPDALLGQLITNQRGQGTSGAAVSTAINPNLKFNMTAMPVERSKPEHPAPAPHTHRYQKVSKDGEGRAIYECTFENCNKSLTIDGELEEPPVKVVEGKLQAVAAEFSVAGDDTHGKTTEGQDTAGKGTDKEAGQDARGPG